MSWMNAPFPPRLSFGIECDPEWDTRVVATLGGRESRNLAWADARHNYDASFAIRTLSDHAAVREHFHMARGRFHSWPLTDPTDHECALADGVVVETATDVFQLHKRYGSGSFAYDRKITRPFAVRVYVANVLKTLTTDYTLDTDTGLLRILDTDTVAADITWSGQFYVPCRYDTNRLPVRVENRTGGAAGELLVRSDGLPIVEVLE